MDPIKQQQQQQQQPRSASPPMPRAELRLHLAHLAHPPLQQVIAHDAGRLVPPFKEHEYRDHVEARPRVKTPRQLGMEGPGPGSPPASPRDLRAAKAHVRFRSRPHSAVAAAREQEAQQHAPSSPSANANASTGRRHERQVLEPGLYPAAGLLLGGLLRPRSEAYASKERLPGLGLGLGGGGGEGAGAVGPPSRPATAHAGSLSSSLASGGGGGGGDRDVDADGFFADLALNANHQRRFHRKAPLSSGDAHRGESAAKQHRKPTNLKMRRVLESDDVPAPGDRGRGEAVGRGPEPPSVVFQVV